MTGLRCEAVPAASEAGAFPSLASRPAGKQE